MKTILALIVVGACVVVIGYATASPPAETMKQALWENPGMGSPSFKDMTELDPMTASDAWGERAHFDGVIFHAEPVHGACDDLLRCASHAAFTCDELGWGAPIRARVDIALGTCSYTCGNGNQGLVSCLKS